MKVRFIVTGAIIVLITCAFFYPVTQQASITINASMFNVYSQLNNVANWRKWNADLKRTGPINEQQLADKKGFTISTPSETTRVRFADAFTFGVKKGNDSYKITLVPQKYDTATTVIVSFNSNLLYELLPGKSGKWLKKTSVNDLKNYMETPLSYYGADFKKITIKDMGMMVYRTVVKPTDRFNEMAKSVKKIRSIIPADELADRDKIYLQIMPSNNDIMMFIAVHVKKQLPSTGQLTYMRIPAGKALIVNYTGRYNDRQKIYTGIITYLQDHVLRNIIQPVEMYTDNGLPLNDTSHVNTQIIFPVF